MNGRCLFLAQSRLPRSRTRSVNRVGVTVGCLTRRSKKWPAIAASQNAHTCSAIEVSRSRRSVRSRGTRRCAQPASRTSAGTTCAIPGQAGTCKTGRRCMPCRRWVVGRAWRWCVDMPTSPPITWRLCGPSVCVAGRGIRNSQHNYVTVRKMKGPASLQALDLLVAGTGFEPVTFGL